MNDVSYIKNENHRHVVKTMLEVWEKDPTVTYTEMAESLHYSSGHISAIMSKYGYRRREPGRKRSRPQPYLYGLKNKHINYHFQLQEEIKLVNGILEEKPGITMVELARASGLPTNKIYKLDKMFDLELAHHYKRQRDATNRKIDKLRYDNPLISQAEIIRTLNVGSATVARYMKETPHTEYDLIRRRAETIHNIPPCRPKTLFEQSLTYYKNEVEFDALSAQRVKNEFALYPEKTPLGQRCRRLPHFNVPRLKIMIALLEFDKIYDL